ncbi:hypothetical protein [Bacillus thuringiensis]|uniref:hypothetical protein n=1 Tax=Bacillus thuringiensis TaxID=1428 RepID=UPI0015CF6116|nr:hypothetical protein [Bacillus thuringiensis]
MMLGIAEEECGPNGFILVRCEECKNWEIYEKENEGNAGIDVHALGHEDYISDGENFENCSDHMKTVFEDYHEKNRIRVEKTKADLMARYKQLSSGSDDEEKFRKLLDIQFDPERYYSAE